MQSQDVNASFNENLETERKKRPIVSPQDLMR